MSLLSEDASILSKNLGSGGSGQYAPVSMEYQMTPSPISVNTGGKKKRTKRTKTAKRKTAKRRKGILGKAKAALKKMFRI
jgi:hypothetical protein